MYQACGHYNIFKWQDMRSMLFLDKSVAPPLLKSAESAFFTVRPY